MAAGEATVATDPADVSAASRPEPAPDTPVSDAHAETEPSVRSAFPEALSGPFSTRQLIRLDEALRAADRESRLTFSVYVGDLASPTRDDAERLHNQLADPANSVLIAISPNQRALEIVTGERARRRLPDRVCALAALSMTATFSGGDLTGGIVTGLRMLTDQASIG